MTAPAAETMSWSPVRTYALETKYEFLKLLRMPGSVIPSIAFPAGFYLLFGVVFGRRGLGSVNMATYLIATYSAFGVIGAALMGFGVGIAIERGQGWMTLKRASPMPPMAFFAARLATCAACCAVIVLVLAVLGVTIANVRMPATMWIQLASTLILGAIPFCALGLGIGYIVGPHAAPSTLNAIYLPMAFISGLAIPIEAMPSVVKSIAQFLPAYHFGQLALGAIGAGAGAPAWTHATVLVGFLLIGLGMAYWGYRNDEDRAWS
jgi:ABC-2 type transport system permease protein